MERTNGEELKEKLFQSKKSGWEGLSNERRKEIFDFCEGYVMFLNKGKTEREVVNYYREKIEQQGFRHISTVQVLSPGDKVYSINRNKSIYLAIIGTEDIEKGLNVVGSHIDSPRLDLKPNPLYEEAELAFLKTQYYGGIKKYQWTTIPLSIHGVIIKTNGEVVNVCIGEDESDPIFTITDLLPHLAQEQSEKKLRDAIEGEGLNILVGNIPYEDTKVSEKVKLNILNLLNEKYGIVESDFQSAELELVPAFDARSLGFDRSMISGYGQDDRVCAYTSMQALFETENPSKTSICMLSDKEEIGSMGNTGMESDMFDVFIGEILDKLGGNSVSLMGKVYSNSKMLSADVDGAFDPIYPSVYEKNNASFLAHGVGLNKYTGSRGKSGSSDANAEFVAEIRALFENNNIRYQVSELGKVDTGGGGTIAYILANKGMDVIDCGVPVLSMHSPYEVTSKFDVYETYRAYKVFWK